MAISDHKMSLNMNVVTTLNRRGKIICLPRADEQVSLEMSNSKCFGLPSIRERLQRN